jgi:hypothetical protein
MRKADEAHYVIAALRAEVAALRVQVDKLRGQLEQALTNGAKNRSTPKTGPLPGRSRTDRGRVGPALGASPAWNAPLDSRQA